MLKKITENPVLKLINNIVYVILFLIVASVLFVVILQRASNNDIALGGIRIFNIVSESMVPKYNIGDVLVVKSIEPQNIKVGDDIAYIGQESTFNQKIVTHQVIKIDYENFINKTNFSRRCSSHDASYKSFEKMEARSRN